MKNLLKNFAGYKKYIIFLLFVLMIQAYCDMSLPRYTQDIIDTGIQDHGIEYLAPERISSDRFSEVTAYMTADEEKLWKESYEKDGSVYKLAVKGGEEQLAELDEELLIPEAIAFDIMKAEKDGRITDADIDGMRKEIEEASQVVGSNSFHQKAVQYVYTVEKEAGLDVDARQSAYLWKEGAKMLLMAFLMFVASAVVAYYASKIGADVGRDLRSRIFGRVMQYSNAEMDQFSTASLITRCTNDVQQIQLVMTMILRMLLYAPVMALWGIINVAMTGSGMEWIIALAILTVIGLVSLMISLTMPTFKRMQTLMDGLNKVSREILTGLSVIRAFGSEKMEEKRFDEANTELTKAHLYTSRIMTMMQPAMMLIMNGLVVLITWTAAHRIDDGMMQVDRKSVV